MTMPGAYDPSANGAIGGQDTANGPKKPDGTFTPSGYTVAKDADAKNERDWATALQIVDLAIKSFNPGGVPDGKSLQERCQDVWVWVAAEQWPPESK